MNSVGRKKSTPKAAAAPSSTSSRKRRSKHQNGGASKRNVSRSKTKLLQVDNTTDLDGVDTSYESNPTQSNQNYKNDIGLDSLSNNNLSNDYKTATNNNNIRNNVSKSPNINEENDINHSGRTPASPPCTRRKKNPLLHPNPSDDTSPPQQHPGKGERLDIHSYINLSAGKKSTLHDIVPTIMNHAPGRNRVLPIIKKVIDYGMDLEQHTRGPDGESIIDKERAANGRIEGNNLRVEIYDVFKLLLGDEFEKRVNIDQFLKDFMGYMIKHFGTQQENGKGTDYINCHSNCGCVNVIEKRMPNYCLSEMIDASVEEGESYVDIVKTRDDSSTTWAQPNANFPKKASQYDKVINFLHSDEKSIRIMFDKRSHASNWRNKHCSDAAVGFTAVAGPELPEHLENFVVPRLGLYDMDAFTLDNNKPLTQKQKEKGEVQLPLLDDQRLAIANMLDGITVQQLLTINWAFHSLQSVIFRLEHGRPAPCLVASSHTVKFITGEDTNHYGFLFESRTNIMWLINHGQSILEGAHFGWNNTHKQGINSAVSGFWSAVTQRPGLFVATQIASNFPLDKKVKLEVWKEAWDAMVKGDATSEQENIIKDSKCWLVHKGWEHYHQHNGDLSGLPADIRDYFTNNISYKKKKAWTELDTKGGVISNVSDENRALLENDPIFQQSESRRLLPECGVLKFGIQDGTIGITFEKPLDSFVCTVKEVENKSSPFRVGDIILSLNDTLLFDKDRKTIGQLIRNSTKRSQFILATGIPMWIATYSIYIYTTSQLTKS